MGSLAFIAHALNLATDSNSSWSKALDLFFLAKSRGSSSVSKIGTPLPLDGEIKSLNWFLSLYYANQLGIDPKRYQRKLMRKYGDIIKLRINGGAHYLVSNRAVAHTILLNSSGCFSNRSSHDVVFPQVLEGALFFDDGDKHRLHRREYLPAFSRENISATLVDSMDDIDTTIQSWNATDQSNQVTLQPLLSQLVYKLTLKLLTGSKTIDSEQSYQSFKVFFDYLQSGNRDDLKGFVASVLERKEIFKNNLYQDLIADEASMRGMPKGDKVQSMEYCNRLFIMLFTGYDTTVSTLLTLFYQLEQNPQYNRHLIEENQSIGAAEYSLESLKNATFSNCCFQEALRYYSPLPTITRTVTEATKLGNITFSENSSVSIMLHSLNFSKSNWPDPMRFRPERFLARLNDPKNNNFGLLPFGGGAHKCIGLHFSRWLTISILHKVYQRYEIYSVERYKTKYRQYPMSAIADGLPVYLNPRRNG